MTVPTGYITFEGIGFVTNKAHTITVLCGDNRPQITDGYAIWQTIPRPLLRGLTVFQGYNPTQMSIELRFGKWFAQGATWDTSPAAGVQVEDDIKWMGWMAGEGFSLGQSPVVYVYTDDNLIPSYWRLNPQGKPRQWVVTALTWGTSYRNKGGNRVWQEATVTLMQFLSTKDNQAPLSTVQQSGGYFTATPLRDTALTIVMGASPQSRLSYQEGLARQLIAAPQNKRLKLRGIRQKIKSGDRVYVPAHTA